MGIFVSVPWSGFINRKVYQRYDGNPCLPFQSRGRDLLIGKFEFSFVKIVLPLVSVPWSGFINRKEPLNRFQSDRQYVSVPWSGFINRKGDLEIVAAEFFQFQSRGRDLLIGKRGIGVGG